MSSKKVLTTWLILISAMCVYAPIVRGQMWGNRHPGLVSPFAYPDQFNPDFQFFAPAEIDTFGGYPDANIGWFASYERLYWNVTRPAAQAQSFQGDFTWGNRYDIGFMTEDEHGWLFSYTHLDGPTVASINQANMESVELNKTLRYQLHKGGFLEPFFGLRFINFKDFTANTANLNGAVENNMLGGQAGLRWFKKSGRWNLSAQAAIIPMANFQFFSTTSRDEFVMAGEIRAQAAYEITRDISLKVSWNFQEYGMGVARQNNVNANSEDLTITGVGFGFEFNR